MAYQTSGSEITSTTHIRVGNHQYANMGDFHYEDTDLYRTPKGAFFVQGTGGAYSRWSRPCGSNGQMGGHGIQALTPTEALDWCEDAGIDADTIAQYFAVEEA